MRTRELQAKAKNLINQMEKDKKLVNNLSVYNPRDDEYWKVYVHITGWYLDSYFDLTIQKSNFKERCYIAKSVTENMSAIKRYLEAKTDLEFKN